MVENNNNNKTSENSEVTKVESSSDENIKKEDSQEKNWKEVRHIMKQLKEENNYLKKEIGSLKPSPSSEKEDPLSALEDDDIVTVGDVKKIVSKYAQNATKDLISKREREKDIESVPNKHSDYYEVIKHADDFEKENPAAAQAILTAPNPKAAGYQMIRNWLKIKEKINEPSQTEEKVQENLNKPVSSQKVGTTSPLNDVRKYEKMSSQRAAEIRKLASEYSSRR